MKRREFLAASGAVAATMALPARAAYPDKAVHYIVPFAPGGETDIAARYQQAVWRKRFGQELVIESKPGAGGALAWSLLNGYPGDGYTMMGTNMPHLVLQPLEGNVSYQTDDITNIIFFNYTPDAIVVRSESPFKTFKDLADAMKSKGMEVSFAGSGTNSANHAAHERLDHELGAKTTYVPFKGHGRPHRIAPGRARERRDVVLVAARGATSKTRVLAVATPQRLSYIDAPTFRELGIDWVDGGYRGIGVPKSTPEDMRKHLSDIFEEINKDPEFRANMASQGIELIDITYEKMPAFIEDRKKAYVAIAKLMGLTK